MVPPVKASRSDEETGAAMFGNTSVFAGRFALALLYSVLLNIMVRTVEFV